MDIKKTILRHLDRKREVKVADIVSKTGFSRAYVHRFFKELRDEGKIILIGRTNKVRYVSTTSQRNLSAIFKKYTNEDFAFDKTKINIKLFELGSRSYVSRSQARRLLFGLEKFQKVIFDFKNVETVGQAFADEVFRIWQKKYPQIKIENINCNENIKFMIKRALQF